MGEKLRSWTRIERDSLSHHAGWFIEKVDDRAKDSD